MNELIATLLRPAAELTPEAVERLAGVRDWNIFCALVDKTGCAALIHARLGEYAQHLPVDVRDRLQAHHDRTIENNRRLLDELRSVTARLSSRGIGALVLKGPILALWGTGLDTRPFHDLDLLVRREDLAGTSGALRSAGFAEVQSGNPYHRVFVRMTPAPPVIVEVHFDIVDGERRYVPELSGVWDRAVTVDLPGFAVSAPGVADHLLLTVMQLPHHLWSLRLLVDIAYVATRWESVIDWPGFAERARAWRMRALTGSTIHAAASLFHLTLPPGAARLVEPKTYVQRVQWHLVLEALSEQLRPSSPRLGQAASWLIFDDPGTALALVVETLARTGSQGGWKDLSSIGRRLGVGAASAPALMAILSGTTLAGLRRISPARTGDRH